jgi:uncharacterized protein (TIGR03118 family)
MRSPVSFVRHAFQFAALGLGLALGASALADPGNYAVHNLVSDQAGQADQLDSNLVNAWGIVFGPNSPVWVSDNGAGRSTVYDGTGMAIVPPSPVCIPAVGTPCPTDTGVPTGVTFNPSSTDFLVGGMPARFLFATEDGGIAAWAGGANAVIAAASTMGAVYKGIAIAGDGQLHFRLFAADLFNGKIDVYDSTFAPTSVPGGFADPNLPPGYAPFNIMNLQGNLYVAFAFHQPGDHDETAGPGLGIVDVFDANGFLIERVATGGKLNAPWGMAIAPADFGKFSGMLLVGNFGDGTINAFDTKNNTFAGQLRTGEGKVLMIDGLWGIAFGNNFRQQPANTLFFAAGPDGESHGLYGSIVPAPAPPGNPGNPGKGHGH